MLTQAAPIPTASSTPDELQGTQTPTPIILPATPTVTPSLDPRPTYQAATAIAVQTELYNIQATQTALANPNPVRELIIGQTSKGKSIRAIQIGNGKLNIVLVGGLHAGFAPGTVTLAEEIAAYYSSNLSEIPPDVRLHIIPNANPDSPQATGRIAGRLNPNEVDLNRNWDCEWKRNALWGEKSVKGGSGPFSELETQALREYFLRNQPVAVVVWEARAAGGMASPGGCGIQSLFSESLAKIYGGAAGYKVAAFEAYSVTGDITNWLDAQGIPAISVLLPDYEKSDLDRNLKAVQTVMRTYSGR